MFQLLKLGSQPKCQEIKSREIGYLQGVYFMIKSKCLLWRVEVNLSEVINTNIKQEGPALRFQEQKINKSRKM